jgi:hypothetical protein
MKKLYAIILLALLVNNATAQTNVSGFINANSNWTMAGSPYHVIGNTILSHGYTLTIDPGVVVKFDTLKALQIDGELIAVGTPQNRIVFTANSSTPGPGSWAKIQFSDTAVDAQFDASGNYLSGSIMKYCDVLYAGVDYYGAISVANSSLCISNCRVNYSSYYGIFVNGFVKIDSTTVTNCVHVAIDISFTSFPYSPYVIEYDTLIGNGDGGLGVGGNNSFIILQNCYFHSCNTINDGTTVSLYADTLIVRRNEFINNTPWVHSEVLQVWGNNSVATIECNKFINNSSTERATAINIEGPGNDTIRNNYFEGHVAPTSNGNVIYLSKGYRDKVFLSNNVFRNNSVGGSTIYIYGQYSSPNHTTAFIDHNYFMGNVAVSDIELNFTNPISSIDFAHISQNNFLSQNVYGIKNNTVYGGPNIDADSNYWGSTSTQHVDSAIYDYFDNSNSSVVYYSPILTSSVEVDTTCPSFPTYVGEVQGQGNALSIYPNPAHNTFTISLNELKVENGKLKIYDVTGRVVHSAQIVKSTSYIVNQDFSPGLYFIRVEAGEKVWAEKVVVE